MKYIFSGFLFIFLTDIRSVILIYYMLNVLSIVSIVKSLVSHIIGGFSEIY